MKIKIFFLIISIAAAMSTLHAQVPQGFNYQAAIRNAAGEVAANASATMRMTIHQTEIDGAIVYQETHNTTTNQFGLVNLIIGEGLPDQGAFDAIPWHASTSFYMQIEVDLGNGFVDIGTQQLMSVPFAMAAKKATDVLLDELNDVNTAGVEVGQTLKWNGTAWIPSSDDGAAYVAGNGISISGNEIVNTGDVSSTNEIQSLILNGANLTLSNGGGSVTLPTGTTYTEGSGIDIVGSTISASDVSATNEIQSLTLSGANLSLSNGGGSVTLPTGTTYTEGSGIDIVGSTISASDVSATNEIQTLSISGANISLSNGGGSVTVPDASSTNEIQSLTLNGANLSLSNGGGSVTLPTGTTYVEGSGIDIVGSTISANDVSSTNEIQSLTLNGANLSLSNGGGSVTLPTGTTYTEGNGIDIVGSTISANDVSSTNEIQSLTLNGANLSLSNGGGSVTLPTGTTYTEGSGIDIVGSTISANDVSATNEIQTLSISGANISLSNGGGSVTVPDASATNEIQSLTLNGTSLSLSNGGGSVTLPTGTTYTAGTGISMVGNVVSNTGDTDASNDLTISSSHSGDVTGLYNNLQIASNSVGSAEIANDAVGATEIANGAVGSTELSQMGATAGQILEWDGLSWSPQTPASTADGVWSSNATNAWRLGGNIGIGTSTPQNGLHLHNKQGLRLTTTFTGASFLDGFYIGQDSDNSIVYLSNFENGPLIFQTNFEERMRIGGNGYVGIGIQAPVVKFHVSTPSVGGDVYSKWSTGLTGHSLFDGSQIGVNTIGQLEILQMESADILFKITGSTKATINSTGMDVNGSITSDGVNVSGVLTAQGVSTAEVQTNSITSVDYIAPTMGGSGNRPVYVDNDGQLYASNVNEGTHYVSYAGAEFNFDVQWDDWLYGADAYGNLGRIELEEIYGHAMCGVVLPEGAVVTSIKGGFVDAMPDGHLEVKLYRVNITTGAWALMAECQSIGSGGLGTNTNAAIDSTPISMANHTFILYVDKGGDGTPDSHDLELIGVSIGYTLP